MVVLAWIAALLLIVGALWDAFETIVLPRRVIRRLRLTRFFYAMSWAPWAAMARRLHGGRREEFLSYYGPLALIVLLGVWALCLVVGFGLIQWALGSAVVVSLGGRSSFATDLYMSGTTFFTLGLGDVVPRTTFARAVTVVEGGTGFAFLALVIAYLPALNQSFSRRETGVSLLDARAGSPPTASEMFRRHGREPGMESLRQLLYDWERWSAEFLEGHLSYPVLAYFRSQHDNQSWLAALTAILDTSALVVAGVRGQGQRA